MENIPLNIDIEKRNRILNAAIKEFANFPYEKASTNNIVKNAQVSKGLVFHYFGNKQGLFDYTFKFVVQTLADEIGQKIDYEQSDLLERLKEISILKAKISANYPSLFDFISNALIKQNDNLNFEKILKLYGEAGVDLKNMMEMVYTKNIDYSLFLHQDNLPTVINVIRWSIEKYSEENIYTHINSDGKIDFEYIFNDFDNYVSVLKTIFYK